MELTHLRQGDGQAAHAAPAVAHGLPGNVPVVAHPPQYLLYRHVVSLPDVQLHGVDLVRVGVYLVPSAEALVVEVLPDLRLVVGGGGEGGGGRGRRRRRPDAANGDGGRARRGGGEGDGGSCGDGEGCRRGGGEGTGNLHRWPAVGG